MSNTYNNNRNRDKLIIDAIVYFKYFLETALFENFIDEIKSLLSKLNNKLQPQSFSRVRAAMGIKDLKHLDLILQHPKNIKYNFHS